MSSDIVQRSRKAANDSRYHSCQNDAKFYEELADHIESQAAEIGKLRAERDALAIECGKYEYALQAIGQRLGVGTGEVVAAVDRLIAKLHEVRRKLNAASGSLTSDEWDKLHPPSGGGAVKCESCGGSKQQAIATTTAGGFAGPIEYTTCLDCNGTGKAQTPLAERLTDALKAPADIEYDESLPRVPTKTAEEIAEGLQKLGIPLEKWPVFIPVKDAEPPVSVTQNDSTSVAPPAAGDRYKAIAATIYQNLCGTPEHGSESAAANIKIIKTAEYLREEFGSEAMAASVLRRM